jgi:hypothetical protein
MLNKVKHAKVILVAIERLSDLEMMESMPSGRFHYSGIIRLTPQHKLEEEIVSILVVCICEKGKWPHFFCEFFYQVVLVEPDNALALCCSPELTVKVIDPGAEFDLSSRLLQI